MLRRARERALALRAARGLDGPPDDARLDALLAAEGLAVVERCPFRGRAREVYVDGVLGIRRGLPPEWVRWLKAHGLAHHLLHHGNHAYADGTFYLWARQEAEAELFAGTLLFGAAGPLDLAGLAERAGVPPSCARSRACSGRPDTVRCGSVPGFRECEDIGRHGQEGWEVVAALGTDVFKCVMILSGASAK